MQISSNIVKVPKINN